VYLYLCVTLPDFFSFKTDVNIKMIFTKMLTTCFCFRSKTHFFRERKVHFTARNASNSRCSKCHNSSCVMGNKRISSHLRKKQLISYHVATFVGLFLLQNIEMVTKVKSILFLFHLKLYSTFLFLQLFFQEIVISLSKKNICTTFNFPVLKNTSA